MTEFPRGWIITTDVIAGTVSITVPAAPGVTHILDEFNAKLTVSAAGAATGITVNVDGVPYARLQAQVSAQDEASVSGMDYSSVFGAALTVAFSAVLGAGVAGTLTIQGHDI